ncbi:MAG: GNAT family N-acetyltransferase [Syntrophobacteraceae bacterium]
MSKIALRSMRDGDIADVNLWPPYKDGSAQMDYALRRGGWLDEYYKRPGAWCYIAQAEGESVGFALLSLTGAGNAELRIALHPLKTRLGFGRQTMTAVMERGFFELGLDTIHLVVRKKAICILRLGA